jgi:hypothetical protein
MHLNNVINLLLCIYLALYIFSIPVSAAWDYPMDTTVTFPDRSQDPFEYYMHTLAFFIASLCIVLFLIFTGAIIILSCMYMFDATEFIVNKFIYTRRGIIAVVFN